MNISANEERNTFNLSDDEENYDFENNFTLNHNEKRNQASFWIKDTITKIKHTRKKISISERLRLKQPRILDILQDKIRRIEGFNSISRREESSSRSGLLIASAPRSHNESKSHTILDPTPHSRTDTQDSLYHTECILRIVTILDKIENEKNTRSKNNALRKIIIYSKSMAYQLRAVEHFDSIIRKIGRKQTINAFTKILKKKSLVDKSEASMTLASIVAVIISRRSKIGFKALVNYSQQLFALSEYLQRLEKSFSRNRESHLSRSFSRIHELSNTRKLREGGLRAPLLYLKQLIEIIARRNIVSSFYKIKNSSLGMKRFEILVNKRQTLIFTAMRLALRKLKIFAAYRRIGGHVIPSRLKQREKEGNLISSKICSAISIIDLLFVRRQKMFISLLAAPFTTPRSRFCEAREIDCKFSWERSTHDASKNNFKKKSTVNTISPAQEYDIIEEEEMNYIFSRSLSRCVEKTNCSKYSFFADLDASLCSNQPTPVDSTEQLAFRLDCFNLGIYGLIAMMRKAIINRKKQALEQIIINHF